MQATWDIVEPNVAAALQAFERPLEALAAGDVPAFVLRGVYPESACRQLYDRLIEQQLLYDPHQPIPAKFIDESIPEGYYREGKQGVEQYAWQEKLKAGKRRIDVGTSLGYRGSNPDDFFQHSRQTHALFEKLFAGNINPIEVIYDQLAQFSRGKRVLTAREPDGRLYGPAIIRAHYGSYTYRPHFDSVRLREKRENYAVHAFDHQFAGVLVLKNSEAEGETAQGILHHYLWQPEVQPFLDEGTFDDFARERGIGSVRVHLEPGDLYFFNTRSIHEVPGVDSLEPRIVLATFIGFSADRDEIFVWS